MSSFENLNLVRSLWRSVKTASLATLEPGGMPHVSLVTISQLNNIGAIMLLSNLARHTQNIAADPRCSLLLVQVDGPVHDVLAQNRITVHGRVEPVNIGTDKSVKQEFLKTHPSAAQYAEFKDFNFYRMEPLEFHLVGGFGRILSFPANQIIEV